MSTEKRNYIRVYDRILLRLKPLSRKEFEKRLAEFKEGKETPWIDPIHPPGEMAKLESYLKRLRERDRELAGLLEIINQKLDRVLIGLLGKEALEGFQEVTANLSAGGLKARLRLKPKPGDLFELDLGLLPEWIFLKTFGEVVRVENCEGEECEVAFKFVWLTEADQDKLVQHIFRQQVLQIQASKRAKC